MSDRERWLWEDMTRLPSIFKAEHYIAVRENELTKIMKRNKCATTFGFRNRKSCNNNKNNNNTFV
jgi:hypothetical protein